MNPFKVNILSNTNALFPKRLSKQSNNSSICYAGNLPGDNIKTIGIVGTRKPTPYGSMVVRELIEQLKGCKVSIISGLALGIDSQAHRHALENKLHTTAVIPADLEHIYPRSHLSLAHQIAQEGGALVSPFQKLESPRYEHFYQRNHLLAGLCDVLIVVEAARRSGTMITVGYALEFGIEVLAVPGRINDAMSQGTNYLISQGATALVSPASLLEAINVKPKQLELKLSGIEAKIIEQIDRGREEIDDISTSLNQPTDVINDALTDMEIEGYIEIKNGRVMKRKLA